MLEADATQKFLKAIVAHPKVAPLLSDDHFTVDGTLVQAWASLKSFVPKEAPPPSDRAPPPDTGGAPDQPPQAETTADTEQNAETTAMPSPAAETPRSRNEEVDFHGVERGNATHASTTDPEARLSESPIVRSKLSACGMS